MSLRVVARGMFLMYQHQARSSSKVAVEEAHTRTHTHMCSASNILTLRVFLQRALLWSQPNVFCLLALGAEHLLSRGCERIKLCTACRVDFHQNQRRRSGRHAGGTHRSQLEAGSRGAKAYGSGGGVSVGSFYRVHKEAMEGRWRAPTNGQSGKREENFTHGSASEGRYIAHGSVGGKGRAKSILVRLPCPLYIVIKYSNPAITSH